MTDVAGMRSEQELVPFHAGRLAASPILALAPHPDDEVFGCGGTLTVETGHGAETRVVVVTDGDAQGSAEVRREESRHAAESLGWPEPVFWGFEDRRLDRHDPQLLEFIRDEIERTCPAVVLVPSPAEVHPDHRAVALATFRVLREADAPTLAPPGLLVTYEVSALLRPNLLVDVTDVWDRVLEASRCFASQLESTPYLEVLEAVATVRRLTLPAAVERAEAFFSTSVEHLSQGSLHSWAAAQGPSLLLEGLEEPGR